MAKKHDGRDTAENVTARVVTQARALLTRAEKKFFDSSYGAALARHTRAQVEAAVKQARILRNKWRDLAQSQSRTSKRAGRATHALNTRTREKHDILAEVVARFERRLDELKSLVAPAASARTAARTAPRRPARPAAKKIAKRPAVRSKKASGHVTSGLPVTTGSQLVRFDRAKQRTAATAAKASRIDRGGQGTQRLGHVAASGRRAQRRRDIRSRG